MPAELPGITFCIFFGQHILDDHICSYYFGRHRRAPHCFFGGASHFRCLQVDPDLHLSIVVSHHTPDPHRDGFAEPFNMHRRSISQLCLSFIPNLQFTASEKNILSWKSAFHASTRPFLKSRTLSLTHSPLLRLVTAMLGRVVFCVSGSRACVQERRAVNKKQKRVPRRWGTVDHLRWGGTLLLVLECTRYF